MNETMRAFGYPDRLVHEYEHWAVILRPKQPTLGALILIARGQETQWPALPAAAFTELQQATRDIEHTLGILFRPDKVNYLMLMMVDPHVHFHVIPRYGAPCEFAGVVFPDKSWPGPPDLSQTNECSADMMAMLLTALRRAWLA